MQPTVQCAREPVFLVSKSCSAEETLLRTGGFNYLIPEFGVNVGLGSPRQALYKGF
jgi:hypothetical protein